MNDFRKLSIWNRSINLATLIYNVTSTFPKSEQYSLTSQIRRSVVSIVQILQKELAEDQIKISQSF